MDSAVVHRATSLAIASAELLMPLILLRHRKRISTELRGSCLLLSSLLISSGIGYGLEGLSFLEAAGQWGMTTGLISWSVVIFFLLRLPDLLDRLDLIEAGHLILQYTPSGVGLFRDGTAPDGVRDLLWEMRSVSAIRDLGFDPLGKTTWLGLAQPGHRGTLLGEYLEVLDTGKPILGRELFYDDPIAVTHGWFQQNVVRISGDRLLITWSNITLLKRAQAELESRVETDPLTGLLNRYALSKAAKQVAAFSGGLYIDLDRFKSVNDTMGHDVGDALLRMVVQRLNLLLGDDDRAFRLGGDEFFVLVADPLDLNGLVQRGEHLLTELQRPYWIRDRSIHLDASIGVVDRSAGDFKEMLRAADLAMYAAKTKGGAVRPWDQSLIEAQLHREQVQLELQNIRERYSQEFELYYQPTVELESPEILTGFEALIRWNSPHLGWVSPGDFIPTAEDSGEISRITYWVLETAIAQISDWGTGLPVAVNVSPWDLEQPEFIPHLRRTCDRFQVPLSLISLEITERAVASNLKYYSAVLEELSSLRVVLKIDDFGTGDSSLERLLSTPWHTVKIDRSLVPMNSEDTHRLSVCRATNRLCQDLGIKTIAEGIETQEQLELLKAIGVDEGQGYYFARPVPPKEIILPAK